MQDRQHIMDVAISLFQREGYDRVTVAQICKEAGIAHSTFYYQFKTKGNLLWEYGTSIASVDKGLRAALAEESPVDRLMCMLKTYAKAYEGMGPSLLMQFHILRIQNLEYWRQFEAFMESTSEVYCRLIESAQKQGEILNMDAPLDIYNASCKLAFGVYTSWAVEPDKYDFEQYIMGAQELLYQVAPHKRRYSLNASDKQPEFHK